MEKKSAEGKAALLSSSHDNEIDSGRTEARAARAGRAGSKRDAPPSNTASYNSKEEYFQPLRWGVDSLYLTYPGQVFPEVDSRLKVLKKLAQSSEAHEQAQAQWQIGEHAFEVKDKAPMGYAYVLEDGSFRIQISRSSKLPVAYVKISSGYLSHVGPAKAEEAAGQIVEKLIELRDSANVSRIDLFVDFASPESMEWNREAWVTRGGSIDQYSEGGVFTGWVIGRGGVMSARLYYKLLHAVKIGADYLLELWQRAGWNMKDQVWRLEFQMRREILVQYGLAKLPDVLKSLNGLWSYATTEWLRLTIPSADDQTRSRWPIHTLWGYLSSIDWETHGGPLSRTYIPARVPGDAYLFDQGMRLLISYMAREKTLDLYQGQEAYMTALYAYHEAKANKLGLRFEDYIAEQLSIKARQFNVILTKEDEAQALKDAEYERLKQALAYRRASKGE